MRHIAKGEQIASLHQASIHVEKLTGESEILDPFDFSHLSVQEATELYSSHSLVLVIFVPKIFILYN